MKYLLLFITFKLSDFYLTKRIVKIEPIHDVTNSVVIYVEIIVYSKISYVTISKGLVRKE